MKQLPKRDLSGCGGSASVILVLLLLVLIAALAYWGLKKSPPGEPNPQTTSFPNQTR